jgi:hypothetical protein
MDIDEDKDKQEIVQSTLLGNPNKERNQQNNLMKATKLSIPETSPKAFHDSYLYKYSLSSSLFKPI